MAGANVAERMGERTGMGARCGACFAGGQLVHEHITGKPIDAIADRCRGCQEPICDRHTPLHSSFADMAHSAGDHLG